MFGNVLGLVKSVVDVADESLGLVTKPLKDGADFAAESLRELNK